MFAIISVGSRQYKVEAGDTLNIPRISNKEEVTLDKVLMTGDSKDIEVGTPYLKDTKVVCDVIGDIKGRKVIAFKFKAKKDYHRKVGHRDLLTRVKVKEIIKKNQPSAET